MRPKPTARTAATASTLRGWLNPVKRLLRPIYRAVLTPRWIELLDQYRGGHVSERDIELFAQLEDVGGLVIDAGANRGQFALSLFAVNRSLEVLAFEPNRSLRWALLAVKALYPRRFRFRLQGLGERRQQLELHEPSTAGFDLSSNASLDPAEFNRERVRERLIGYSRRSGGQYRFKRRTARLIRLDALAVSPLVIKIDVEGWELQALEGMRETIGRCHPLLMIELNKPDRFFSWLQRRGYRLYGFNADSRTLSSTNLIEGRLNIFAIHPETPDIVVRRLTPLIEAGTTAGDESPR